MGKQRVIKARDIIADLRMHMSASDLMKKYKLTANKLYEILQTLLGAKAVLRSELAAKMRRFLEERYSGGFVRSAPRSYLYLSVPVYDTENMEIEAWLNDISENGLQVNGIRAEVGCKKSLLIRADEFVDVYPFVFDAVCRWINEDKSSNDITAGFEITDISDMGQDELGKLMGLLTMSEKFE